MPLNADCFQTSCVAPDLRNKNSAVLPDHMHGDLLSFRNARSAVLCLKDENKPLVYTQLGDLTCIHTGDRSPWGNKEMFVASP